MKKKKRELSPRLQYISNRLQILSWGLFFVSFYILGFTYFPNLFPEYRNIPIGAGGSLLGSALFSYLRIKKDFSFPKSILLALVCIFIGEIVFLAVAGIVFVFVNFIYTELF